MHRIAALVKCWLLGTHQGSVVPAHLPAYHNEYVFRFNRRTPGSRGMLFLRLLELAVDYARSATKTSSPTRSPSPGGRAHRSSADDRQA